MKVVIIHGRNGTPGLACMRFVPGPQSSTAKVAMAIINAKHTNLRATQISNPCTDKRKDRKTDRQRQTSGWRESDNIKEKHRHKHVYRRRHGQTENDATSVSFL